jgi:hypothetical protein
VVTNNQLAASKHAESHGVIGPLFTCLLKAADGRGILLFFVSSNPFPKIPGVARAESEQSNESKGSKRMQSVEM